MITVIPVVDRSYENTKYVITDRGVIERNKPA